MITPSEFMATVHRKPDNVQPETRIGVVTSNSSTSLMVRLDGDTSARQVVAADNSVLWAIEGDRVVCRRVNRVWVAEYRVANSTTTGSSMLVEGIGTGGDYAQNAGTHQIIIQVLFEAVEGHDYEAHAEVGHKFTAGSSASILAFRHAPGSSTVVSDPQVGAKWVDTQSSAWVSHVAFSRKFTADASGTYTLGLSSNFFTGSGQLIFQANSSGELYLRVKAL